MEVEGGGSVASYQDADATVGLGLANFIYTIPISVHAFFFTGGGVGILYYKENFKYTEYYYTTSYYYTWYYGIRSYQTQHRRTVDGPTPSTLSTKNFQTCTFQTFNCHAVNPPCPLRL